MAQPFHRPLFLLTVSGELETKLRQIIERPFVLHRVADWAELRKGLLTAAGTAVCFVDATVEVAGDRALAEGLREMARDFPLVAFVACLRVDSGDSGVLRSLESWGVADILDFDRERSIAAVARRLEEVKGVWAHRLIRRVLPRLSARGRTLVEAVAGIAAEGGHVPELANALGIYRRTVPRWCAAAGVPDARRIFSWIRLLLAGDLLDDERRTIENVARVTGFSSGASLKSAALRFTGFTPSELRARGAFSTVARLCRGEFQAAKEALHESRAKEKSWFN